MKLIIGAIAHGCAVMGLIGALLAGADGTARSANRNWHGVAEAKRLARFNHHRDRRAGRQGVGSTEAALTTTF
jgi:hypothetical protein